MCVFVFIAVSNKNTSGKNKEVQKQTDKRALLASSEVTQIYKKNSLSHDIGCGLSFVNI